MGRVDNREYDMLRACMQCMWVVVGSGGGGQGGQGGAHQGERSNLKLCQLSWGAVGVHTLHIPYMVRLSAYCLPKLLHAAVDRS